MCRVFGQIASRQYDPSDYLIYSQCSLLAQSKARRDFLQQDGWGVAGLVNGSFSLVKSPNPIYKEVSLLKKAAEASRSKIVIAHIRAASNPLKLPKKQLIAWEHAQPFTEKRLAFAHNGTLNIAQRAREALGPLQKNLKGRNDSEIYFWLLMKWLKKTRSVPKALESVSKEIWQIWQRMSPKERGDFKLPYTGLNVTVSDGKRLYGLCHSLKPQTSKSLCLADQPYNRLAYLLNSQGDRLIVASEKMSKEEGWRVMPMHALLEAWVENGKVKLKIRSFKWLN